jgi:hypothetical protein
MVPASADCARASSDSAPASQTIRDKMEIFEFMLRASHAGFNKIQN